MKPTIYFTDDYEVHFFGSHVSVCWKVTPKKTTTQEGRKTTVTIESVRTGDPIVRFAQPHAYNTDTGSVYVLRDTIPGGFPSTWIPAIIQELQRAEQYIQNKEWEHVETDQNETS